MAASHGTAAIIPAPAAGKGCHGAAGAVTRTELLHIRTSAQGSRNEQLENILLAPEKCEDGLVCKINLDNFFWMIF